MEILWLAILIYSLGLAGVLHVRPAAMFHENGAWKEFGYQRSSGHTLFPFWLFAITWAFVSYALATAIAWSVTSGEGAVSAVTAATAAASSLPFYGNDDEDDGSDVETEPEIDMTPVSRRGRASKKPRPGYYVLDPSSGSSGLRKYVYYGPQAPTE